MGRDLRVKHSITVNHSTSQWQNMSYCLSAFPCVEKRADKTLETQATPIPSMSVSVWCRVMCISLEQMEQCLSGHAKTQTLALSRVHSILQTDQGCIVALGNNLFIAQCSDMDRIAAWLSFCVCRSWTIFTCAVKYNHDEVVWHAVMRRNVTRPDLCLYKWAPVQMRRFYLMPRRKWTYYQKNKRAALKRESH